VLQTLSARLVAMRLSRGVASIVVPLRLIATPALVSTTVSLHFIAKPCHDYLSSSAILNTLMLL